MFRISCFVLRISLCYAQGLGCSAFARCYLRNLFDFFSSGYLDVSVPQVPYPRYARKSEILNPKSETIFKNQNYKFKTSYFENLYLINLNLPQYQNKSSVHGPEPYFVLVHGFRVSSFEFRISLRNAGLPCLRKVGLLHSETND